MISSLVYYSLTLDNEALGVDTLVQDWWRLDISAVFQSVGKAYAIRETQNDRQRTAFVEPELFSQSPAHGGFHLVSHFSDNL